MGESLEVVWAGLEFFSGKSPLRVGGPDFLKKFAAKIKSTQTLFSTANLYRQISRKIVENSGLNEVADRIFFEPGYPFVKKR